MVAGEADDDGGSGDLRGVYSNHSNRFNSTSSHKLMC